MSVTICPTITVETEADYLAQMERIEPFAKRIHVDASDGVFAPRKLLELTGIWWRGNRTIDLHLMYKRPAEYSDIIIAMWPRLVIIHAEAEGDFVAFSGLLRKHGIEVGVALLQETPAELIVPALELVDHVLIFSGNLGHQGGSAVDFDLLHKVQVIRAAKPNVEIGWDGGVNDETAKRLAQGGIDVLNVGGYIQSSSDPAAAFAKLQKAVA